MRMFLALDFDMKTQNNIVEIQKILKKSADKGRWAYYKNIHLTVKFIGDADERKISQIADNIESALSGRKPMKFSMNELGFFRGKDIIRVAWIGLKGDVEDLIDLNHKVENSLTRLGISKEKRKFLPHITLGREIEFNNSLFNIESSIKEYLHDEFLVNSVTLYSSRQEDGKRVYEPVKRFKLKR
jgi:2'-5' RNA ligase